MPQNEDAIVWTKQHKRNLQLVGKYQCLSLDPEDLVNLSPSKDVMTSGRGGGGGGGGVWAERGINKHENLSPIFFC